MSIVINNNASIADKEEHVFISDNERRVSIIEETSDIAGLGTSLTKIISYKEDEENHGADYNYNFIPTVSCDNYDYVNVYGHNQM